VRSAESPTPKPAATRPSVSSCRVAQAEASTEWWRVTPLVTPVPNTMREVPTAAAPIVT
jgi:hypothetical protein